MMIIGTELLHL